MNLLQHIRQQVKIFWAGTGAPFKRTVALGTLLFASTASAGDTVQSPKNECGNGGTEFAILNRVDDLNCRLKKLEQVRASIRNEFATLDNEGGEEDPVEESDLFRRLRMNRTQRMAIYGEQLKILGGVEKSLTDTCLKARIHGDMAGVHYNQYASFWPKEKDFRKYKDLFKIAEQKRVDSLTACILDEAASAGERIGAYWNLENIPDYMKDSEKSAAVVYDIQAKKIIHDEDAHKRIYPASLVKMMTLLLMFDDIGGNKIKLNDKMIMTKEANAVPISHLYMKTGKTITVQKAMEALIVVSANNVAEAVAFHLGKGDRDSFIQRMNDRAATLHLDGTHFINPSGLHDDGQYTTAADMVKLIIAIRDAHPKLFEKYFRKASMEWEGQTIPGHNWLLVDGGKTGSTYESRKQAVNIVGNLVVAVMGRRTAEERDGIGRKLITIHQDTRPQAKPWKRLRQTVEGLPGQQKRIAVRLKPQELRQ